MKNIFSNTVNNTEKIIMESEDFCYEGYLISMETVLEDLYYSINENQLYAMHSASKAGNLPEILQEGFKDFADNVIEFFNKLIEKIKAFFKKALMYLNSFIGNFENFVKKYSSEISKRNVNFEIEGYKFTIDSHSSIDFRYIDDIISSFNSEINTIPNMKKSEILKRRRETMADENLNKIRGSLINMNYCNSDNYTSNVKKLFRNGESDTVKLEITRSEVSECANSYSAMKTKLKESKKERDNIITKLESIKSFFGKGASVDYLKNNKTIGAYKLTNEKNVKGDRVDIEYSQDNLINTNIYFNYRLAYSKAICNMYSILLVEKTNAIKDYLKQSRTIIRKALFHKDEGDDK